MKQNSNNALHIVDTYLTEKPPLLGEDLTFSTPSKDILLNFNIPIQTEHFTMEDDSTSNKIQLAN